MKIEGKSGEEIKNSDNNSSDTVYVITLKDEIGPHTWREVRMGFEEAAAMNAALVVIHLNTYGGTLVDADSIRSKVLYAKMPVYAYIDNNAASAGALISVACDSIYMSPGASIGAATVVNQTSEAMPDKYQSFMRGMMRATAEANGRDPQIAEAMVDPDVYIPKVSDSGKVLTLTVSEAIKYGYCEGEVDNINEVIDKAELDNPVVIKQTLTALDKIINFFMKPFISGLLIMMIIGGIYFELQTPGVGFPLAIAILGVVLYFFPLYIGGLVEYWEIVVFAVGFILLALEIFVIPGFGVAGISGIILILTGLIFAMVPNKGFHVNSEHLYMLATAISTVISATIVAFVLSLFLAKKLLTTNNKHIKIALNDTQQSSAGFSSATSEYANMINCEGIAHSVLRPSGKVMIGGDVFDAVTEGGWIEKGEAVKVVGYLNAQLVVRANK
ncbi:MAG: NfeD family protein [Bacteroidales bacterium]|nr:NfeD family protein [Bacteroidales bacterium]